MANDLPIPEYGNNLVESLTSEDLGKYVIYTQQVPWELYGSRFSAEPLKTVLIEQIDTESLDALVNDFTDCDLAICA